MSTIVRIQDGTRRPGHRRKRASDGGRCEIVIFPGVRIERHDIDLGHRVREAAGDDFGDLGGSRPRKTS